MASSVTWCDRENLFAAAKARLLPAEVVLDIGCGIQPQEMLQPRVHVCCEPFPPYLKVLAEKSLARIDRNWVLLGATWEKALDLLPEKSVDTIFLLDVIEHVERQEGERLLQRTLALARRQLVIFTPLGFMPQSHPDGTDMWGLGGGSWQEHKSGWGPEDFREGWEVVASKDFHLVDNMGKILPEPFGALFAIRTFEEDSKGDVPDVPLLGLESSAHHAVSRLFRNTRRMLRRRLA